MFIRHIDVRIGGVMPQISRLRKKHAKLSDAYEGKKDDALERELLVYFGTAMPGFPREYRCDDARDDERMDIRERQKRQ